MNNIRIAVTLLNTLRPVGPVSERDQTLLNDTLLRELGTDYAGFLAEPVPSGDGVRVDWYVDAKSRPRALEDLSADEQKALLDTAEKQRDAVLALADRLEGGSRSDKEVAQALRNAMHTPESGWLYDVDGKPVIVGWGYVSASTEKRDMGLKAVGTAGTVKPSLPTQTASTSEAASMVAEKPEPPTQTAPQNDTHHTSTVNEHHIHNKTYVTHEEVVTGPPFNWLAFLLWALFALLLLIFLWLLFSSNALSRWSGLFAGPQVEQSSNASTQRIGELNREIGTLENQLNERQMQCANDEARRPSNDRSPPDQPAEQPAQQPSQQQPLQQPSQQQVPPQQVMPQQPAVTGQPPVVVAPTVVVNPNENRQTPEEQPPEEPQPTPAQPNEEPQPQPEPEQQLPQQGPVPEPRPEPEARPEPTERPERQQSERQRELDDRINRSGAQSGALQITLSWDGRADLDLSIACPSGSRVYFKRPRDCGALLDRDANRHPARISREPIENIFFSNPGSLPAQIPVYVDYYASHGDPRRNVPFQLRIRKTRIDPATGKKKIEDKIINGVADGTHPRNPRRIYVIKNP